MTELAVDTRSLVVEPNRQLNWSQEDRHQDADTTRRRNAASGFRSEDEAGDRIMGAGWSGIFVRLATRRARRAIRIPRSDKIIAPICPDGPG
jgi:hypothetical protein